MGRSGQLADFPDGNEILYINGIKFYSERKSNKIYLVSLMDSLEAKWESADPIWDFIMPPYTQCINDIAAANGTEDLISSWVANNGGIINVYNPGMKDNGVIVTRMNNHVYVDVNYNIRHQDYDNVDGFELYKVVENGLALWANYGRLYANVKEYEQMGNYAGIEVNVTYAFNPIAKSLEFNFWKDSIGTARSNAKYTENVAEGYDTIWKIHKKRKIDIYNVTDNNSNSVIPLGYDSIVNVTAHEFGHAIGLSDAYAKPENNLQQAPLGGIEVPEDDIMRSPFDRTYNLYNGIVTPNNIEMMLLAFMLNEQQSFYTSSKYKLKQSEAIQSYNYVDAG